MEINKRCISAFAKTGPFVALATKSKLFDPTFSLTSELILVNYMTGQVYPAVTTDLKFCKILWCEFADKNYLVAGHENGYISIYERTEDGFTLVKTRQCLEDDITALDFLVSKSVLVAASSKGKVIFWTLSNLDKEFSLDVQLPPNITAISCNPKVFKILCVGTSDGIIKVVDIKKTVVVLTLKGKDFNEVKQLEWDTENNTKLRVMSEKPYVNVFDLSNDTVSKIGEMAEPLIGFHDRIFVTAQTLLSSGACISIPESFDCSISCRDPMAALSLTSGKIQILSIPAPRKKIPFCRIANLVVGKAGTFKITIQNKNEASESDPFYDQLIEMMNSAEPCDSQSIADFLLDNAMKNKLENTNEHLNVSLDMSDEFTQELIRNNFENLKKCDVKVNLSVFDVFMSKSNGFMADIKDFRVLMVLCKILNDYTQLGRVNNPRALAALLMYHKISNLSILNASQEGRILGAILSRNFGAYLDNRCTEQSYLKRMKEYEQLLSNIQQYISTPLESKRLSEYFWYQVFVGNLEEVESLNVIDPDIKFYLSMSKEQAVEEKIKKISLSGVKDTSRCTRTTVLEKQSQPEIQRSNVPVTPIMQTSVLGRAPPVPTQIPARAPVPTGNTFSTQQQAIPPTGYQAPQKAPVTPQMPAMNIPCPKPMFKAPATMQTQTQSGYQSLPTAPLNTPVAQPYQNVPKSPFSGPIPMNPLRSSVFSKTAGGIPQPNIPKAPSPTPVIPQKPGSPVMTMPSASASRAEDLSVDNPAAVVSKFDSLVADVRQKAALNTSMILKHRKNQFLNALNSYDGLEKVGLPSSILYCMELLMKRIDAGGPNMKTDLSILVEGHSDIAWLKAFVELVKMVY